jgi:hypothetical protein
MGNGQLVLRRNYERYIILDFMGYLCWEAALSLQLQLLRQTFHLDNNWNHGFMIRISLASIQYLPFF